MRLPSAGKLGLPDYIIDDARTHLTEQDESFEDLLTDLETSKRTIRKEQEEIEHYKRELERLEEETRQKRDKLEEQRDRIIREANEKAHEILADAKETADETMRNFHKFGKANISVAEMEKERERLRKKMNATQNSMKTDAKKPKKTYKASDFKLGESVKVLSMNLTGSVTSLRMPKGMSPCRWESCAPQSIFPIWRSLTKRRHIHLPEELVRPAKVKLKWANPLRSVRRSTFLEKRSMRRWPNWISIWMMHRLHISVP